MAITERVKVLFSLVLVFETISSIYSSQRIASILGYQEGLYGAMGKLGTATIYFPFSWWGWYLSYNHEENIGWIFEKYGFNLALMALMAAFLLSIIVMAQMQDEIKDTHGTAHWAEDKEMYEFGHFQDSRLWWEKALDGINILTCFRKKLVEGELMDAFKGLYRAIKKDSRKENDNNLLSGQGVFLGIMDDGRYLRDNAKTHTLLIAPTRSGKGVGHIIPTLLTWEGSCVVTDVKGENWELTSGYRKSQLGNKVMQFKPNSKESCHYNPFGEIRFGTVKEMGDLQLVTKILVDPTGKKSEGENSHWVDNAWQLLQGVTLHLLYQKMYHNFDKKGKPCEGRIANLSDVLDFLYDGQDGSSNHMAEMERTAKLRWEKEHKTEVKKVKVGTELKDICTYSFSHEQRKENCPNFDIQIEEDLDNSVCDGVGLNLENKSFGARVLAMRKNKSPEDIKVPKTSEYKPPKYNMRSTANINAKPLNGDGKKPKAASLKGLQAKLEHIITDSSYQYIEETDTEIVSGFRHAPDDNIKLFEELYPDKISRYGMHPHVRQIFQAMIDKPDKEFGSILSTLDTALILYRNPVIVENISKSDFVMKDLMDSTKAISLYLVFGPGEIDVVRPLTRVIIETLWRMNVEEMKFQGGKTVEHQHRLLMLLDEFPALGKMGGIEQSEGFLAGYGIKAMIIAQDLNQINSLYGKDNYVVSNCQVQVFHAPSDLNGCEYLSKRLGNRTIKTTSQTRNSKILNFPSSFNDSYTSRPLMYPDEIASMKDTKLLLFCKGLAPVLCNKIRYFEDPVFAPRVKITPPGKSDRVYAKERKWDYSEYEFLKID